MKRVFSRPAQATGDERKRRKRTRRLQLQLLTLAVVLALANILLDRKIRSLAARESPVNRVDEVGQASVEDAQQVVAVVKASLQEFHINAERMRQRDRTYFVSIPRAMCFIDFYLRLRERVRQINGQISRTIDDGKKERYEVTIAIDGKTAAQFYFIRKAGLPATVGAVAIIVDDFGYGYNEVVNQFICFPLPMTLAVLPGLPESRRIVREAQLANREILVHMPMEPLHEKFHDDGHIILANHDPGTIRLRIRQAFTLIPEAVGLNNHQGSRVVTDRDIMTVVITEIKRQNKIFIDSYTHPRSVAMSVARSLAVPCAANQVFIDAKDEEAFIEGQMERLADLAYKQGKVVGIAHVRKRTLKVLQRKMPELQARGIEFVYVSEIL